MKRKIVLAFLTAFAVLSLCLALAACGGNSTEKQQEQTDLWSMERVYSTAKELGFQGTLDELIAMFKGDKGDPGQDGKNGAGIQSVEIDENGHLKFTLTDGTVKDAGKVTPDSPAEEGTEGLQYQKRKDEAGNEYLATVGLGTAWDIDIVIPSSYHGFPVKEIGASAFDASKDARNGALTSISIPDSVTEIGDSAFSNCSGLTNVTIPDSVTSIGYSAFEGCSGLTSITLPFVGATKDDSQNTHFGYIFGAYSYSNNSSDVPATLKTVIITGGTSIGEKAFFNCKSLTEIMIPDSMTTIEDWAFRFCSGLTSVTIGNGVTTIGERAFEGCDNLESVTFEDPTGWSCSGTELDATALQNPSTAAVYFTKTYCDYTWTKNKSN